MVMRNTEATKIIWAIYDYDSGERVGTKTYATVSGAHAGMRAAYAAQPDRRFTMQPVGWTK
jgi:hypothetical protein